MEYSLSKASLEDMDKIDKFIHENFLPDLPLKETFGIHYTVDYQRSPSQRPPLESEDFIVMAVDGQGELIGVATNIHNPKLCEDLDIPPEMKRMMEFLKFAKENAELDKLPERTMQLGRLTVSKQWRQRGVARGLVEESMRIAKASGFQAVSVCCTSEFTARLLRNLGWREHYRLAHKDYPRLSGKDVYMKHIPPHENLYYYVKELA